jgi:hypothetical protein
MPVPPKRAALALAVTAATAVAALALPSGTRADPLSVFQPKTVRTVSVRPVDLLALRALPPLDEFGTVRTEGSVGADQPLSAAVASRDAGYALRLPATLPPSLPNEPRYHVTRRSRSSFTFSKTKAAAWARQHNVPLHPLPAGLDGTTYTVTLQPITAVTYGTAPWARDEQHRTATASFLGLVQSPLPQIASTGAPLRALTGWFAAQPGISKRLAAQIQALGDPAQTLPIPIRFNEQTASKIAVDGVEGLAIGDETGIGSVVVWTKDGRFYAIAGSLPQSDLLALANDLK